MIKDEWTSDDGSVRLICGDCLEVLPTLEAGSVDAVVTDPPYGINASRNVRQKQGPSQKCAITKHERSDWDSKTEQKRIDIAISKAPQSIVFGGNYYQLPLSSCWLVWDKVPQGFSMADVELAWTNLKGGAKLVRHKWQGMLRDGYDQLGCHPTQKPVLVMERCINLTSGQTILDPFMGSGTTGVAAVRLGRKFIGIEIEPKYFQIAKRRIQAELDRYPLFESAANGGDMPGQLQMFEDTEK